MEQPYVNEGALLRQMIICKRYFNQETKLFHSFHTKHYFTKSLMNEILCWKFSETEIFF